MFVYRHTIHHPFFTSFLILALFGLLLPPPIFSQSHPNTTISSPWLLLCGNHNIPFPFHLNSSSSSYSSGGGGVDPFRLTCVNSTTLFLAIGSLSYKVLHFYSDAVLVDFPNTTSCRQYNDLKSFGFDGNAYFGISTDNVLSLYDCEDSSLCKSDCQKTLMPGCHQDAPTSSYPACCYPLSDRSAWHVGDGFSGFSEFGCRGFSCWVVDDDNNNDKRGIKLEWGIPLNSTTKMCASNAQLINATAVPSAARCQCLDGFVGDGFAQGTGCIQSCLKDGKEAYGDDCYTKRHNRKNVVLIAGLVTSALSMASLTALLCVLKRPSKFNPDNGQSRRSTITTLMQQHKACRRSRLFSYDELEEATKGFDDAQKLMQGSKGTLYAGTLVDGSHIVVHKLYNCETERDMLQVLSQVEVLSSISHTSIARVLGCSIDSGSGSTPLVVYGYPANGTLEDHLRKSRQQKTGGGGLSWYKRLNIAAETASVLAYLRCEISPPISHHDLSSGCILLDEDLSVKIAGFGIIEEDGINSMMRMRMRRRSSDVYNMGVILLEMISGFSSEDLPTVALQKIRIGKLEEIVDPMLYKNDEEQHEQQSLIREQIEKVADVATRCLLFGGDQGKLGMIDVAREVVHITKETAGGGGGSSRRGGPGPALEETFSNSSLLQMISMSPDSIYHNIP